MTNLINAAFFLDARNALAEFNAGVEAYNYALSTLRDAAQELETAKDALETELQSARDALESALAAVKSALEEIPCEIESPGDCDDQSELAIDFDSIETQ